MPTRTDIRNQILGDIAVKKSLKQRGDDERAIHTINHQMLAPSEAALVTLGEAAKVLAFEVTPIKPVNRPATAAQFTCDLVAKNMTLVAVLARQSILMGALAEAYGCVYNGWGTVVIPLTPAGGAPATE